MKNQGLTFADRLETAAKAKQALLDKARQKDPSNDPEFAATVVSAFRTLFGRTGARRRLAR